MTAQTYVRIVDQPNSCTISGEVRDIATEYVASYSDPTQVLLQTSGHADQTTLVSIGPIADYSIGTGTPVSATPTIPRSNVGGKVIYLCNIATSTIFMTIQSESILSGSILTLNYPCRTLAPEMSIMLMNWGVFGQATSWREIGNMDDVPQASTTAFASGGQANATVLKHKRTLIDSVSTGASVRMPVPLAYGMPIYAINVSTTQVNLFPIASTAIGNMSLNSSLAIPAGKTAHIWPSRAGRYDYILST